MPPLARPGVKFVLHAVSSHHPSWPVVHLGWQRDFETRFRRISTARILDRAQEFRRPYRIGSARYGMDSILARGSRGTIVDCWLYDLGPRVGFPSLLVGFNLSAEKNLPRVCSAVFGPTTNA